MPRNIPVDELDVRDVELLVRSHHPLLFIEDPEPARVESLLKLVALALGLPFLDWRAHRGLQRVGVEAQSRGPSSPSSSPAVYKTESAAACLAHLRSADNETISFLRDFSQHLQEPDVASRLVELHERLLEHQGALVLSGDPGELPESLARYFTSVRLRTPSPQCYHDYVSAVLADVKKRRSFVVDLSPQDVAQMIEHLRGLPFHEIRKIVTQAVIEDGRLDRADIATILEAKRRIIQRSGILEYIPADPMDTSLAGLRRLKRWLEKRRMAFEDPRRAQELGLPSPRGLLLTGVQGCGKSLSARAISSTFHLPLVRMDPGSLYRKYFGESEANLRRALKTAESVAPCILWIDEIEKAFSQGDSDGGTSRRILGTFLTWLQDKQASVFVFATANDISQLPPELLRKGRFDEIFFVDLPDAEVRAHIFALHLAKRKQPPDRFDLERLAAASDGFSGAEIEQAVVSGLYSALSEVPVDSVSAPLGSAGAPVSARPSRTGLTTEILLRELGETQPLSVTMAEKVAELRGWAAERAVSVD